MKSLDAIESFYTGDSAFILRFVFLTQQLLSQMYAIWLAMMNIFLSDYNCRLHIHFNKMGIKTCSVCVMMPITGHTAVLDCPMYQIASYFSPTCFKISFSLLI